MAFIATCFAYRQGDCDKAYRYFRRASKLSHIKRIHRGYYKFTLHVPALWQQNDVELAFRRAFGNAIYSAPIIEELPIDVAPAQSTPTPAEALRSIPNNVEVSYVIPGARALEWRGDTVKIEFNSREEAEAFFNAHDIKGN